MTLRCTGEPFSLATDPPVRGVLHRVADGEDAIVLTHGAGSDHRAAALVALAQAFAARGVTALRCDLPFRQARATGPPARAGAARDRDGLATALAALTQFAPRRLLIGGFSYGGRQASMLVAEHPSIAAALLVLSYPLHPPGKSDQARTAHLSAIRVPTLFVHGSRDPFGTGAEIEAARALISAPTEVFEWSGAGHGLPADHGRMTQVAETFLRMA